MTVSRSLDSRNICPAKINLGLEVLRKREDGYHELNTLFVRVEQPHDVIEVTVSGTFQLTASDPTLSIDGSNLIRKAADAFSQRTGLSLPSLHLDLIKSIPMGAGLGGGSSNAATTLRICNEHYDSPLSETELIGLGAKVGADVPFFITNGTSAIAGGIGDKLEMVDLSLTSHLLIVKPASVSISTKDAYARITPRGGAATDLFQVVNDRDWSKLENDFERAIFPLNPELPMIKNGLLAAGADYASMSGSGSAIFGLFEEESTIDKAAAAMENMGYPCWRSTIGQKR
ncbi:MAG TPA: 4-(cytidine 5'-diphospho)-2-C-methyl-D-erythritol kinase [Candidatus Kapabacteria bacterium]|nr:4-(cytidine 5'-diphospho)-2-C-methyl-D-erythritol kinase [Candidatus Kapabacteria bacterium]